MTVLVEASWGSFYSVNICQESSAFFLVTLVEMDPCVETKTLFITNGTMADTFVLMISVL